MTTLDAVAGMAQPWADFYNDSTIAQTGILFLHFGALLVAGGYAIAADGWVLRTKHVDAATRSALLNQLNALHRPVIIGLCLLIVTGGAMAFADAEVLLTSGVFWFKMSCFAVLLANGLTLLRAESRLRVAAASTPGANRAWSRLQWAARRSVALWLLTLLLGTLLGTAA